MTVEDPATLEPVAPSVPPPARLAVSGERARAAIAAELDRREPHAVARNTLSLLAESALLEHGLYEDVSDEDLARAVAAAVAGLQDRHPALFRAADEANPPAAVAAAPRASRRENPSPAPRVPRPVRRPRAPRPPITVAGWPLRDVLLAAGALVALVAIGFVLVSPAPARGPVPGPGPGASSEAARGAAATADVVSTGSVAEPPAGPLAGVPEIVGPATLRLQGRTLTLLGIEDGRGEGAELRSYLAGRPVSCRPAQGAAAAGAYECDVEGRDLSEVILFNGGAKAGPDATPALVAAEDRARAEHVGIWRR